MLRIAYWLSTPGVEGVFETVKAKVATSLSLSSRVAGSGMIIVDEEFAEYEDADEVRQGIVAVLEERVGSRNYALHLKKSGDKEWSSESEFVADLFRENQRLVTRVAELEVFLEQSKAVNS